METGSKPGIEAVERYRALLDVSDAIAHRRELKALCHDLAQRLHQVLDFEALNLLLYDAERDFVRLHTLESAVPAHVAPGFEVPASESPAAMVLSTGEPLVVDDIETENNSPVIRSILREHGVRSYCALPLITAQRKVGILAFGSSRQSTYHSADLVFLKYLGRQVAVAVDNALNYEAARQYQEALARKGDQLRLLLETSNALHSQLDFRELFVEMSQRHREVHPEHDFAAVTLFDPESGGLKLYALDMPQSKGLLKLDMTIPIEGSPAGYVFRTREPLCMSPLDPQRFPAEITRLLVEEGVKSGAWLPLITRNRTLGTLGVGDFQGREITSDSIEYLTQIANIIAIAIENARAFREIGELKDRLSEEKLYLEDEIRTEFNFDEIVGESPALAHILKQVEIVAPTDSTVLLLGETGTGKEVLARAIHKNSARAGRTFVKLNCAAIPAGLLESELFGHEKGAFTGAISQKVGRIELADKGTLFLDEVGDIPMELQPKLLRVLQEREFERLGSTHTRRVDVRLIAATNRDLAQMIADKEFRSDLYYRLYVFPIIVAPLRERRGDIPSLVRYFVQKYARRMNRRITTIPAGAMHALAEADWPGNIRELENFIERAVILSSGPSLKVPLQELKSRVAHASEHKGKRTNESLEEAEREHIRSVLRETNGVVAGPNGAAARLGLKRTTLQSKMKKLGLARGPLS